MTTNLLTFNINGDIWSINLVDIIDGTSDILGQTRYIPQDILLIRSVTPS